MRSAFIFLAIGVVSAQTPISGPVEGFTFDLPTQSLRPVIGSLGSASLGNPALRGVTYASAAPQQNYALTFEHEHCSLVLGLGSAQTSTVRVPGTFQVPEGVVWSGDGSTAILYSRAGNWIQVLSGLPNAVSSGDTLSIASLQGTLSSLATDSQGKQIALGIVGQNAGVYQLANGTNFVPVFTSSKPAALGFSEDDRTLYGIDAGSNQVFALTMAGLTSQTWPLNGLTDPVAIKPAHDASNHAVVYVAGGSDRLLVAYDPATHQVLASAPLNFQPSLIQALGVSTFLLAERASSDDILWSFRNTPQPTIYFVPAPPVQPRESTHK